MNYSRYYQTPKVPPVPPTNYPNRANYCNVQRRPPMAPTRSAFNYPKEERDTRCAENTVNPWRPCDGYPNTGSHIRITVPTPDMSITESRENNPNFHLLVKVSKFVPEEIFVKADNRLITIECKRYERADDEGGWAAYHFTRRIPIPPGVNIKYMEAWFSNGILNIWAPNTPRSYETGTTIAIDVSAPNQYSSPQYVRTYPNASGMIRAHRIEMQGTPAQVAASNFQCMSTIPGCSWSLGLDDNYQRGRQVAYLTAPPVGPQPQAQPQPQKVEEASEPTKPVEPVNPTPEEKPEQTPPTPVSNTSLEDLSYEVLSLSKEEIETDSEDSSSSDPTDG